MKLNLGSSTEKIKDFINVDCRKLENVDIVCDLEQMPWQWQSDSVDEIYTSHCFEHLHDPISAINECHRILKPNGKLTIIVPNARGTGGFVPCHYSYFSKMWFESFFCSKDYQIDYSQLFTDMKIELHLVHHRLPWNPVVKFMIEVWDKFWNSSPKLLFIWDSLDILPAHEIKFTAKKR